VGTWGPAIFSDDLACDIRDEFRELVSNGASPKEATEAVCSRFKDSCDDPDEGSVFWVALASTAWSLGRLEDSVKTRALEAIEKGEDLVRWDDSNLRMKREVVLKKLAEKLRGPPHKLVQISKPKPLETDWERGEVVGFQMLDGRWTLLHVRMLKETASGRYPIVERLGWFGQDLPSPDDDAAKAAILPFGHYRDAPEAVCLILSTKSDHARFARFGMFRKTATPVLRRISTLLKLGKPQSLDSKSYAGVAYLDALFSEKEKPTVS
jgi:hypothetical protein